MVTRQAPHWIGGEWASVGERRERHDAASFKGSGSGRLGGVASIEDFLEYRQITQDFIPGTH